MEKMEHTERSWKIQDFKAHDGNVNCLAMGQITDRVMATGGNDKKVNIWGIGKQRHLMSLSGHTTPVECAAFIHSDELLCAGSQTGVLKMWDLEVARLLRTFLGHKGPVKCMDFHPYGDYLITGSCDGAIKMWDIRRSGSIFTFSSHRLAVNSMQFSPDGQWIASGSNDGIIKVWDVRMGKVVHEFSDHTAPVTTVRFHPHEFLLASCDDHTINFFDMEKFEIVSKYEEPTSAIRCMRFTAEGAAMLVANSSALLVLGWEPTRVFSRVPVSWGHVRDINFSYSQLIAGSYNSSFVQLAIVDMEKVYPFGGSPPPSLPSTSDTSPFQRTSSVRKSFSKEKPSREVIHRPTKLDEKTIEESTSSTENDEEAIVPTRVDYTEAFQPSRSCVPTSDKLEESRTSLRELLIDEPPTRAVSPPTRGVSSPTRGVTAFTRGATTLTRGVTFPTRGVTSPTQVGAAPPRNLSPTGTAPLQRQRSDLTSSKIPTLSKMDYYGRVVEMNGKENNYNGAQRDVTSPTNNHHSLNRQHSYKEAKTTNLTNPLRPSNSDANICPPSLGPRSLSFSRITNDSRRTYETSRREVVSRSVDSQEEPEQEFVPFSTDKAVGLDLDEFLPRNRGVGVGRRGSSGVVLSEQEVLGIVMGGHDAMMKVLSARLTAIQVFNSVRINKNLKFALESLIALDDLAIVVDILNVMAHKPSVWNLDICLLMLPKISDLLQSKYETYMQCGCNALRLIMRNFSSVVRANVSAPVRTLGVDIPREERYTKCIHIHRLLVDMRSFLLKRQTMQGRLGALFRDLHVLMQQGLD